MRKKLKKKNYYQKGPRNVLILALVAISVLFLLTKLTEYSSQIQPISYSSFIKRIENGDVKKVRVSGEEVYGIFKNGDKFETVIPDTPKNWEILKKHDVEISVVSTSGQFSLWYLIPLLSLLLTLLVVWYFMRQKSGGAGGGGANIFTMGKSRAKMFMPSTIKDKFDSVAGAVEAKEELKDIIDFLKDPEKYRRLGAKMTKGILLVGEPGNGKTLLARAVAGEANCPLFSIYTNL